MPFPSKRQTIRTGSKCAPGLPTDPEDSLGSNGFRMCVRPAHGRHSFMPNRHRSVCQLCVIVPVQRESMNVQYPIRCKGIRCGMNEANNADCKTNGRQQTARRRLAAQMDGQTEAAYNVSFSSNAMYAVQVCLVCVRCALVFGFTNVAD